MTNKIYRFANAGDIGKIVLFASQWQQDYLKRIEDNSFHGAMFSGNSFRTPYAFVKVTLADFSTNELMEAIRFKPDEDKKFCGENLEPELKHCGSHEEGLQECPAHNSLPKFVCDICQESHLIPEVKEDGSLFIALSDYTDCPKYKKPEQSELKDTCAQCGIAHAALNYLYSTSKDGEIFFCSEKCQEDYEWVDAEFPRDCNKECRYIEADKIKTDKPEGWQKGYFVYRVKPRNDITCYIISEELEGYIIWASKCQVRRDSVEVKNE